MYQPQDIEGITVGSIWYPHGNLVPRRIIGIQGANVVTSTLFTNRTSTVSFYDLVRLGGDTLMPQELAAKTHCHLLIKLENTCIKVYNVMIRSISNGVCKFFITSAIPTKQPVSTMMYLGVQWNKYEMPIDKIQAFLDPRSPAGFYEIWMAKVRNCKLDRLKIRREIREQHGLILGLKMFDQIVKKLSQPVPVCLNSALFNIDQKNGEMVIRNSFNRNDRYISIPLPSESKYEFIFPTERRELCKGDMVRYLGNRINMPNIEHLIWTVLQVIKASDNRNLDQVHILSHGDQLIHKIVFRKELRLINSTSNEQSIVSPSSFL